MKSAGKIGWLCFGAAALILSFHLAGCEALAAEKTSNWRSTYDLIMRWVNFGIIVFIVNKYAKGPIINFLRGRKEKVAKEIQVLEDRRDDTVAKIKETQQALAESEIRFADLKERIVQQGDRKKAEIIESARQQSRIMLDDAHRRVSSYILEARSKIKSELVDFAVDLAIQRLPKEIAAADNEKFIEQYLTSSEAK